MTKSPILVLASLLALSILVVGIVSNATINGDTGNIVLLTGTEIRNPEIATKYGISGYVDVTFLDLPQEITISRGGEWQGTMELRFVSYTPELAEIEVHTDPNDPMGPKVELGSAGINVSTLVSYEPSGVIRIKVGENLLVRIKISIPMDFPQGFPYQYIPACRYLYGCGIWSGPGTNLSCLFSNPPEIEILEAEIVG